MSSDTPPPPTVRTRAARLLPFIASVLALALAAVLLIVDAPVVVRSLVVLPVIVLVAGSAATRLLLGRHPDRLLARLLSVVLGILMLLASVLVAQAVGIPLTAVSAPGAALGLALLLLLAAQLRRRPPEDAPSPPVRRWLRPVLAGTAAAVVLVGALGLAVALQPTPVERYTLLAFTDPARYGAEQLTAAPGSRVALDVGLTSYGQPLAVTAPGTTVTLANRAAAGLRTRWTDVSDAAPSPAGDTVGPAVDQRSARLSFRAPDAPGLYALQLQVAQAGADPLLLTAWVQVNG